MVQLFKDFKGQIIWSADGVTLEYILQMIDSGNFPMGVAIKLDRLFLTRHGLSAIEEVQKRGVPVFADAKLVEIPSKVLELTKDHLQYQPWMLNAMADICNTGITPCSSSNPNDYNPDVLNDFARLCKDAGTLPCAVTVLTSKEEELVLQQYNRPKQEVVEFFSKLSIDCELTDVVCPAPCILGVNRLGTIGTNPAGIRLPNDSIRDQSKTSVLTPAKALAGGATRLVIGQSLSEGGNFHENFAKIMADIEGRAY